jgi:hypothetical protein
MSEILDHFNRKIETTRKYNRQNGNGGFFDKPVNLSVTEAEALQAEIERLTAALATAEAERDAAKRKIRMALAELQSEVDRDTEYDSAYIDEAHAILYNALTPEERAAAPVYDWEPLPAAAPAVDDEPVGDDDDEPYDVTGAVEYARGHVADALVSASNGNYERAFGHLNAALTAAFNSIEALITKGETR